MYCQFAGIYGVHLVHIGSVNSAGQLLVAANIGSHHYHNVHVCAGGWTISNSRTACQQLGFGYYFIYGYKHIVMS